MFFASRCCYASLFVATLREYCLAERDDIPVCLMRFFQEVFLKHRRLKASKSQILFVCDWLEHKRSAVLFF